jgi:hypothetical protein
MEFIMFSGKILYPDDFKNTIEDIIAVNINDDIVRIDGYQTHPEKWLFTVLRCEKGLFKKLKEKK